MLELVLSILDDLRRNFRIADAVDILLISALLYSVLIWFRQTASRRVAIGISVVMAVYVLARFFDLYLTSLVFHTGFAVLLIVLVVIFQEDLRRMFERIAAWGTLRQFRSNHISTSTIDRIIEATFSLASKKRGALIVIAGREGLDRHLVGGVSLVGQLSPPLLYSIFDPHSAGHDGAVVVLEDRVEKFATHLPISRNRREIGIGGTRHSAGLGLSECSDALIIIVSEERGTVSVAEQGRLKEIGSVAELKTRLLRFYRVKYPQHSEPLWERLLTQHARYKIIAVLLAMLVWLLVAYDVSTVQRTFVVPIEYRNVPENLALADSAATEARLTLSGSERSFRFLEPGTLRISIDMTNASAGVDFVPVTEKSLKLPTNVSLYRIEPRLLRLSLQEVSAQTVQQGSFGPRGITSGG